MNIAHIIRQYQLLSDWYISVLENIADQDGSKVINNSVNSLEWLAGHLITGRYRNLVRIGVSVEPYKHLDKFVNQSIPPPNAIAFSTAINYAALSECKLQWEEYTMMLMDKLHTIINETLTTTMNFSVPIGGNKVEDALAFVTLHESYHIGQMSTIRKSLGYPAMQLNPRKR